MQNQLNGASVRGQAPELQSKRLSLPEPETLGIQLPKSVRKELDWSQLRKRLDELGALSFRLDKEGQGYRFFCQLPDESRQAFGLSEAEAVEEALSGK